MVWEHSAKHSDAWELYEGPDDLARPRLPLATVHRRISSLGQEKRTWYQVWGEPTEYATFDEAKAAAEMMARVNKDI
jgi:hypothetical protein